VAQARQNLVAFRGTGAQGGVSVMLALLAEVCGQAQQATDLLAPLLAWFTEGFETPDLRQAKALL
jgi:hypothetical protein